MCSHLVLYVHVISQLAPISCTITCNVYVQYIHTYSYTVCSESLQMSISPLTISRHVSLTYSIYTTHTSLCVQLMYVWTNIYTKLLNMVFSIDRVIWVHIQYVHVELCTNAPFLSIIS